MIMVKVSNNLFFFIFLFPSILLCFQIPPGSFWNIQKAVF